MNPILKLNKRSREFEARHSRKVEGTPLFRQAKEDRITDLPSCLKTKILSCLPTKDAVRTSVLSTNWEKSWTSVTNLDFDLGDNDPDRKDLPCMKRFTNFVDRILKLRDRSCLQKFRLYGCPSSDLPVVDTWLSSILLCNVQEIDLFIPLLDDVLLPSSLFVCKSLVILKLNVDGYVKVPSPVYLPCLKTLEIFFIELSEDKSISSIMSGCPVLEELCLGRCIGSDVGVIHISSPSMKRLYLKELPHCPDDDYNYQIILDTPNLQFLDFSDEDAKDYSVQNLNNVMEADISFGCPYEWFRRGDNPLKEKFKPLIAIRSKSITSFLNEISQVKRLVLSHESLQTLKRLDPMLPVFSHLTYIKLTSKFGLGWRYLPKLLEKSPCLHTLYLRYWMCTTKASARRVSFDGMPSCFLSNFKEIQIDGDGWFEDMDLLVYFLLNVKVLEKLTITYRPFHYNSIEPYQKLLTQLQKLPRSSATCVLDIEVKVE